MEQDDPGTPEYWAPNPWERAMMISAQIPPRVLVCGTVQNIFQRAKEDAIQKIYASARETAQSNLQRIYHEKAISLAAIQRMKTDVARLPRNPQFQYMTLRFLGGQTMQVPLTGNCNTQKDLQRDGVCGWLRRNSVQLFIPGIPEPLPVDQDLRHLLPNIPELEIVIRRA